METSSVPFKKNYNKIDDQPIPPGFWIGIIMILILLFIVDRCKGGGFP